MGTRQLELLVKEHSRSGTLTIKDALQFFDRLLAAKNPEPSIDSFNQLFTALTLMKNSNNHYATVFSFFNRLTQPKSEGVSPSPSACTYSVSSLFNRWTQPRRVSPSPDVCTYSGLISYCIQMKQPRLGLVFLGRFIKDGHRAEPNIFNPLLKGLCSEKRISEAVAMAFNKMPKLGCSPNLSAYRTVIRGLCREGEVNKAFSLFEQMLSEGIAPDLSIYTDLLKAYAMNIKVDQAMCVLNRMKQEKVKPDFVASAPILELLLKIGRDEDTKVVMEQNKKLWVKKKVEEKCLFYKEEVLQPFPTYLFLLGPHKW